MTITAPPRPPQPCDSVDWADPEVLIAEARRRARRRRRRYAAVAVALLALVATSFMVIFGRPGPSESPPPEPPPTLPIPPDPDDAASIVAKFGEFHGGWVLVYADGRVIKHSDSEVNNTDEMFERRLTANGLDLIRSGAIELRALLPWPPLADSRLPADTWAEPEFKPYGPSRYAACLNRYPELAGVGPGQTADLMGRLPTAALPLLRGIDLRTYNNIDLVARLAVRDFAEPPVECFEVSTGKAIVLFKTLRRAGFASEAWVDGDGKSHSWSRWAGTVPAPCAGVEQPAEIGVCFHPILPHGEWVVWGG